MFPVWPVKRERGMTLRLRTVTGFFASHKVHLASSIFNSLTLFTVISFYFKSYIDFSAIKKEITEVLTLHFIILHYSFYGLGSRLRLSASSSIHASTLTYSIVHRLDSFSVSHILPLIHSLVLRSAFVLVFVSLYLCLAPGCRGISLTIGFGRSHVGQVASTAS